MLLLQLKLKRDAETLYAEGQVELFIDGISFRKEQRLSAVSIVKIVFLGLIKLNSGKIYSYIR